MSPQLLATVDSLHFNQFDAMPRTWAFLDTEHDDFNVVNGPAPENALYRDLVLNYK